MYFLGSVHSVTHEEGTRVHVCFLLCSHAFVGIQQVISQYHTVFDNMNVQTLCEKQRDISLLNKTMHPMKIKP